MEKNPQSSCGKTYPESSTRRITHLDVLSLRFPGLMKNCIPQPTSEENASNGPTLVVSLAQKELSLGEFLTPNTSDWPNDAAVCSLSQVLEKTSIPPRFFLSSTACAGILRRAEKRGKKLPRQLEAALRTVVRGMGSEVVTAETSL